MPLSVRNGCPEISEKVAHRLIQQLEEQQLPQLEATTQASVKAITELKASWWVYLKNYVKTGSILDARAAVDKAAFFDYKDVIKDRMITKIEARDLGPHEGSPHQSSWEKEADESKVLDCAAVERPRDAMKHLSFVDCAVYVNMSTLLSESDFEDVWKVIQWAALEGRICTVVAKDAPARAS